jgi:hypothetical protein
MFSISDLSNIYGKVPSLIHSRELLHILVAGFLSFLLWCVFLPRDLAFRKTQLEKEEEVCLHFVYLFIFCIYIILYVCIFVYYRNET